MHTLIIYRDTLFNITSIENGWGGGGGYWSHGGKPVFPMCTNHVSGSMKLQHNERSMATCIAAAILHIPIQCHLEILSDNRLQRIKGHWP